MKRELRLWGRGRGACRRAVGARVPGAMHTNRSVCVRVRVRVLVRVLVLVRVRVRVRKCVRACVCVRARAHYGTDAARPPRLRLVHVHNAIGLLRWRAHTHT